MQFFGARRQRAKPGDAAFAFSRAKQISESIKAVPPHPKMPLNPIALFGIKIRVFSALLFND